MKEPRYYIVLYPDNEIEVFTSLTDAASEAGITRNTLRMYLNRDNKYEKEGFVIENAKRTELKAEANKAFNPFN